MGGQDEIWELFCEGSIIKEIECSQCIEKNRSKGPVKIIEDSLWLNVQESFYYSSEGCENFLQEKTQIRRCKICDKRTEHMNRVSMEKLPRILAIRIADNPQENLPEKRKLRMELEMKDSSKNLSDFV